MSRKELRRERDKKRDSFLRTVGVIGLTFVLVNWVASPVLKELLPNRSISVIDVIVYFFLYPLWIIWAMRRGTGDHARAAIVAPGLSFIELLDLRDDIQDE